VHKNSGTIFGEIGNENCSRILLRRFDLKQSTPEGASGSGPPRPHCEAGEGEGRVSGRAGGERRDAGRRCPRTPPAGRSVVCALAGRAR
jgi:hypothetical protein